MPKKRINMRKIKEILRLKYEVGLSHRDIQRTLGIGYGTIASYLQRAEQAGLSWPSAGQLDERTLARHLFPTQTNAKQAHFVDPDFNDVRKSLSLPHMTKLLAWQEYREQHPEHGYSYAQFCHRYKVWLGHQRRSMRQVHKAGEKTFVDYCGPTLSIVNPDTGEIRSAQVFVGVLGASNYTFAEATLSQKQADWVRSHVNMFEYFGGTSEIVVPDNLKSAVTKAHPYDPQLNPAYQQMATHYNTAIVPARPYKPKDKAKAEVAVQIVERWIMARLRHQTFFTLADLNMAIKLLLEDLNNRPLKKLPGTRKSQFEQLDKPLLKPLPVDRYQYVDIKLAKVHIDYHVEYEKHYYSVPHQWVGCRVEIQASENSIAIYAEGKRITSHARSYRVGGHNTIVSHMPEAHKVMHEWSSARFLSWASDIGEATHVVVDCMLTSKHHPAQSYRSILALLTSAKRYGRKRLNAACERALLINSPTRTSVESILKSSLDKQKNNDEQLVLPLDEHENIRGADYFH